MDLYLQNYKKTKQNKTQDSLKIIWNHSIYQYKVMFNFYQNFMDQTTNSRFWGEFHKTFPVNIHQTAHLTSYGRVVRLPPQLSWSRLVSILPSGRSQTGPPPLQTRYSWLSKRWAVGGRRGNGRENEHFLQVTNIWVSYICIITRDSLDLNTRCEAAFKKRSMVLIIVRHQVCLYQLSREPARFTNRFARRVR